MTYEQAEELLSYILLSYSSENVRVHQIGNGTWVCLIKNPFTYIWDWEDWIDFSRQAQAKRTKTPANVSPVKHASMNLKEAQALLADVLLDSSSRSQDAAYIHEMGNDIYVVVVRVPLTNLYSREDWIQFRKEQRVRQTA